MLLLFITVYYVAIKVALEAGRTPVTYTLKFNVLASEILLSRAVLLGIGEARIFLPIEMEKTLIFFRLMKN